MIRTISIAAALSLAGLPLGACSLVSFGGDAPPATAAPPAEQLQGACEALRPDFPIRYHGGPDGQGGPGYDRPDTIAWVRSVNARFAKACP